MQASPPWITLHSEVAFRVSSRRVLEVSIRTQETEDATFPKMELKARELCSQSSTALENVSERLDDSNSHCSTSDAGLGPTRRNLVG